MTNFEWIKQKDTLLKEILTNMWGVYNGTPESCLNLSCMDCEFSGSDADCGQDRENWLESTHECKYKRGDVVVTQDGEFWCVTDNSDDELGLVNAVPNADLQNHHACLYYCGIAAKIGTIEGIGFKNENIRIRKES